MSGTTDVTTKAWIDIGMRVTVPLLVACVTGITGIVWDLHGRMSRVEQRQSGIYDRQMEIIGEMKNVPGGDYRQYIDSRFTQMETTLLRIENLLVRPRTGAAAKNE